jgi:hypothetical protein
MARTGFLRRARHHKARLEAHRITGWASALSGHLTCYASDPRNAAKSEHEHYGPYGSLEIMTWPDPGFDHHAIRGSLTDLTRLAKLVETKLETAKPNSSIHLREEFANESPYSLLLDVRGDEFDPASADPDIPSGAT